VTTDPFRHAFARTAERDLSAQTPIAAERSLSDTHQTPIPTHPLTHQMKQNGSDLRTSPLSPISGGLLALSQQVSPQVTLTALLASLLQSWMCLS
jgi:hypothetical protein